MYSYPFAMQVPDWLPASMCLAGTHEEGLMRISYSLTAAFIGSSGLSSKRTLYVFRPPVIFPVRELSFDLKSVVGGIFGMGTSEAISTITFEKNEYYLGEKANVRVVIDNSNCSKDIKSVKFKLHRHYLGRSGDGWTTLGSNYLISKREPGCPAGQKIDKTFEIEIPSKDPTTTTSGMQAGQMHPDDNLMLESFSTTVSGAIIQVAYTLKCFVKHDSWNEFGEGKVVSLPVKIVTPPITILSSENVTPNANW